MSDELIVRNGRIFTPEGWVSGRELVCRDGRIAAIRPVSAGAVLHLHAAPASAAVPRIVDAEGGDIVPGFIDLHIHGAGGSDFMDATPYAVDVITAHHAAGGTTAMLATTAGQPFHRILEAAHNVAACRKEGRGACELLGLHIEGPYFSLSKKGCHVPEALHPPRESEWRQLLDLGDVFKHITVAPELPGALELIEACAAAGVRVAAGHSEATYPQTMAAVERGLSHVTHLYSVMATIVKNGPHRIAGLLEATLLEDRLTTEIIADNYHVNPELARLAYKCKSLHQLALITDAMRGMGMPDGEYTFGGFDGTLAVVENGVAVDRERKGFASSTCTMADCVRNCCTKQGQSYEDALLRASLVPAQIAQVAGRKGRLAAGWDADVVVLGPEHRVETTISRGRVCYQRTAPPAILKESVERACVELPRLQRPARV
ncbi:MAG: N-acetylglucosamine-6-phosphate deacetylase [Planctomycetota bacterium]